MENTLNSYDYANIFTVLEDGDGYSYYNLLSNLVIEGDIDDNLYTTVFYNESESWYSLSYKHYGTTRLWWVILLANNINNPFEEVKTGDKIKILRKEIVSEIISNLNT